MWIVILIIIGIILVRWLGPFITYMKIGNYADYKPISKSLNDKAIEYSYYQINGFKNLSEEAIGYLRSASKCCTKNDLKWLEQCSTYFKKCLVEAEEKDESKLFLSRPIENTSFIEILKVIKRTRKSTSTEKIGYLNCGEVAVMLVLFDARIQQIKNGEEVKPGDMDFYIDAIYELRNN